MQAGDADDKAAIARQQVSSSARSRVAEVFVFVRVAGIELVPFNAHKSDGDAIDIGASLQADGADGIAELGD